MTVGTFHHNASRDRCRLAEAQTHPALPGSKWFQKSAAFRSLVKKMLVLLGHMHQALRRSSHLFHRINHQAAQQLGIAGSLPRLSELPGRFRKDRLDQSLSAS